MSVNAIKVAILGLGRVGASAGLALARYSARKDARQKFELFGFDPRPGVASAAEKMGAVQHTARNVFDAVSGKDINFVAMPYAEVENVFREVADALREDVVVLDASPLKLPSLEWRSKLLPAHAHLIGVTPVANPRYLFDGLDDTEHAAADFSDDGFMLVMPDPRAAKAAVELATDFSALLGATPHFVDPGEHDGLIAATEGLPALLGVMTFYMLQRSEGWADARRMGNPAFGQLTHHLVDTHPDDLRDLLLNNRQNVTRYLGELIEVMMSFHEILARGDGADLEAALVETYDAYQVWLSKRTSGRWVETADSSPDKAGDKLMSGLVGGFLARRLRGEDSD
ncbi:MAG: prephenate dehydrogenase [Anaerolineae bacterium]|nr:prephenate dehydrogenase [Anaerolineae bacterium]